MFWMTTTAIRLPALTKRVLGIRIGYMRFYDCSNDDTSGDYSSGCNSLRWGISSKYSRIFCNSSSSCSPTSSSDPSVNFESASGGTPLASAMNEAKLYLDAHKAADSARDCRQKFAILITDGSDTYACGGTGSEDQADQYKRRRATVARAKALADAGYRTFVVGFRESHAPLVAEHAELGRLLRGDGQPPCHQFRYCHRFHTCPEFLRRLPHKLTISVSMETGIIGLPRKTTRESCPFPVMLSWLPMPRILPRP